MFALPVPSFDACRTRLPRTRSSQPLATAHTVWSERTQLRPSVLALPEPPSTMVHVATATRRIPMRRRWRPHWRKPGCAARGQGHGTPTRWPRLSWDPRCRARSSIAPRHRKQDAAGRRPKRRHGDEDNPSPTPTALCWQTPPSWARTTAEVAVAEEKRLRISPRPDSSRPLRRRSAR